MTPMRSSVVAVSNSEQQRETLVIMLDPDFDVTAIATPAGLKRETPAMAVILSAGEESAEVDEMTWNETLIGDALRRCPQAGLVLVDAPQPLTAQFPDAVLATWSDPFSVPAAVADVSRRGERPLQRAHHALAGALAAVDLALRPEFETTLSLAALLRSVRRPESVEIAARFLGEQVSSLLDQLAWVDGFDYVDARRGRDALAEGDFVRALRAAIDERSMRALCRGLNFEWNVEEGFPLPCSEAHLLLLARSLRAGLLDLPPGSVRIETDDSGLRCRHTALRAGASLSFAFAASASLLRRAQARFAFGEGWLSLARDDEDDRPGV